MDRIVAAIRSEFGRLDVLINNASLFRSVPLLEIDEAEWDRVMELQQLQREDLLQDFLEKQQRLARTLGAAPPTTDAFGASAPEESPAPEARVD